MRHSENLKKKDLKNKKKKSLFQGEQKLCEGIFTFVGNEKAKLFLHVRNIVL